MKVRKPCPVFDTEPLAAGSLSGKEIAFCQRPIGQWNVLHTRVRPMRTLTFVWPGSFPVRLSSTARG